MKTEDALKHVVGTLYTRSNLVHLEDVQVSYSDVLFEIAVALENVASLLSVEERT